MTYAFAKIENRRPLSKRPNQYKDGLSSGVGVFCSISFPWVDTVLEITGTKAYDVRQDSILSRMNTVIVT